MAKKPKKYRVYIRYVRTDKYEFLDISVAVSGMQARNNVRHKHYRKENDLDSSISFDELRQRGLEFFAASYGSERDIEFFNLTRPSQPPVKYYKRQELPTQKFFPGMGRNAQLL